MYIYIILYLIIMYFLVDFLTPFSLLNFPRKFRFVPQHTAQNEVKHNFAELSTCGLRKGEEM